jgi:hypothetical protein
MSTLRQAAPPSQAGLSQAVSVEGVYPAAPEAVSQARRLVAAALSEWHLETVRDVAVLAAGELAANAASQGLLAPPPEMLARVSRTARHVIIAAGDHNPAGPPAPPRKVPAAATEGRGLLIVSALSDRYGWYLDGGWKVVWAAILIPPVTWEQPAARSELGRAA